MQPEQLVGAARRYQAAHLRLIETAAAALLALWARNPALDDAQLAQWLGQTVPLVRTTRRQAVGLAAGYIGAVTGETLPVDAEQVAAGLRGGVGVAAVYSRPTITLRAKLAEGLDYSAAVKAAAARLDATARGDVALAARQGAHEAMAQSSRIVGYRRVTDGKACMLCLTASTQRYHIADLMPIHSRCGCTIAPIIGAADPGHILDRELLDRLKGVRTPVAVHEHGELGPVLTEAGQHFTGPAQLAS